MTTIKLKNGSGAPTAGDLVQGEPALDLTNKRLYTEDSVGTVIEVGTNPTSVTTGAITATSETIVSTGSNAFSSKAVGGYAIQAYQDATSADHTALDLRSDATTGTRYLIRGYNDAAGTPTEVFSVGADGTVTADGLTVDGTATISGAATAGFVTPLLAKNPSTNAASSVKIGLDAGGTTWGEIGASYNTNDPYMAFFVRSGSEKVRITDAGNVGIGTSSPSDLLHLNVASGSVFTHISSDTKDLYLGYYSVNGMHTVQGDVGLAFHTGDSYTERMRIDSSGNVGIGATSPIGKLDVSDGTNPISIDSSTYNEIQSYNRPLLLNRQGNNVGIGTDSPGVLLDCSGSSPTIRAVGTSASNPSLTLSSAGITAWSQTVSGSDSSLSFNKDGSERMRIDSSGNLLVGTTDASGTTGSGIKLTNPTSPADDGKLMIVGASTTIAQDGIQMYSTGASAYRFFVQYSGQINATSTSINAISDVSLKENIRDLDKGLETILALQPRRFDWKNGDGNDIMGFVAQEVETVLPELVHDYKYNDEETKLGLKMGDMIPSLVKAIQEQNEIINDLRARVAQLEGAN